MLSAATRSGAVASSPKSSVGADKPGLRAPLQDKNLTRAPSAPDTCASTKAGVSAASVSDVLIAQKHVYGRLSVAPAMRGARAPDCDRRAGPSGVIAYVANQQPDA
jgi:hypothetical protein